MEPIIEAKNLGKRYDIVHQQGRYIALRDVLATIARRPLSFLKHKAKKAIGMAPKEEFWALRGVSFSVGRGEVVGVIGRNGAGKSTLLKILTGITPPTEGEVTMRGRVSSLLEVGTGFHPELTGRENIFLNGAILGMKKAEIIRKFDEIVSFAGIERFLDTPVKYYSSGMYVRLAFSVAAHMEPDILLVDEVLAVGDAEFQKKCLGKMEEVTRAEGRTILFVSHNLSAIQSLCKRVIVIDAGRVVFQGPTKEGIDFYLEHSVKSAATASLSTRKDRKGSQNVRFTGVSLADAKGRPIERGVSGEPLSIKIAYESKSEAPLRNCRASVLISTIAGEELFLCSSELTEKEAIVLPPKGSIECRIDRLPLNRGEYSMMLFLEVDKQIEDWIDNAAALEVENGDFYGTGAAHQEHWRGVLVAHRWRW